jgi:two-component system, LuxR family, response regulator FixJ
MSSADIGGEGLVYVVDDDEAVRDAIAFLLEASNLRCRTFGSAAEFLEAFDPALHACLVADIRMPGLSGLELQGQLNRQGASIPVIFITGHGDVPMAVNAMKAGAFDFIQKPFREQDLIARIQKALDKDRELREQQSSLSVIREKLATLTPRETEVMGRVVNGQANKVIAFDLGVSQRTVELHRARVMRKLGMRSLADLVRVVGSVEKSDG